MLNLIVLTTEVSSSRKHFKWKIFNSQYFEATDLENFDIQYIDQEKEKGEHWIAFIISLFLDANAIMVPLNLKKNKELTVFMYSKQY